MAKAYILSTEGISLSAFAADAEDKGCLGILAEITPHVCISSPPNTYASCSCGPKVLTAQVELIELEDSALNFCFRFHSSVFFQFGTITDDDGAYVPGRSNCTWLIAPPATAYITIYFRKLMLGGAFGRDLESVDIDACLDRDCSTFESIEGSPFNQNMPKLAGFGQLSNFYRQATSKLENFVKLKSVKAKFLRIRFRSESSVHSYSRFMLHYSAHQDANEWNRSEYLASCNGILRRGVWNHLAVVVHQLGSRALEAELFVNGLNVSYSTFERSEDFRLQISGASGLAIGRADPSRPPPTFAPEVYPKLPHREDSFDRLLRGSDSFWEGGIDELRVWKRALNQEDLLYFMNRNCSATSLLPENQISSMNDEINHSSPIACYSFDTLDAGGLGFPDVGSRPGVNAIPIVGDRHIPWCTSLGDNGVLIDKVSNPSTDFYGASWGFCEAKPRLPGVGFEYSEEDLLNLSHISDLVRDPGCSFFAIRFAKNTARRYEACSNG